MSEQLGLGKLITQKQSRDAIHIAVAPVTAADKIAPGDWLKFAKVGDTENVCRCNETDGIGIADPFLTRVAFAGDRLWIYLRPGSVTSLRHEWTHPAFSAETMALIPLKDTTASETWLRAYVANYCPYDENQPDKGYGEFLDGIRSGTVFYHGSDLHGFSELKDADDLRFHLETVLGTRINWGTFSFSCSC